MATHAWLIQRENKIIAQAIAEKIGHVGNPQDTENAIREVISEHYAECDYNATERPYSANRDVYGTIGVNVSHLGNVTKDAELRSVCVQCSKILNVHKGIHTK